MNNRDRLIIDEAIGFAANCSMHDDADMTRALEVLVEFKRFGQYYQSRINEYLDCLNDALYCGVLWKDLTIRLIQAGADPLQKNGFGVSALDYFICLNYDIAEKILSLRDELKKLIQLVKYKKVNALPLLEAADYYGVFKNNPGLINSLYQARRSFEYYSLLHAAVCNQPDEVVRFLLEKGADPQILDNYGCTPLDYAVMEKSTGKVQLLQAAQKKESVMLLGEMLGYGACGEVYKSKIANQDVAVKICEIKETEIALVNRHEASIYEKLHHLNIVNYFFSFETQHIFGIVTEYCNDNTLHDFIDNHEAKIIEKHFFSLSLQMIAALGYLHSLGYVHLDFKSSNLLLHKNEFCETRSLRLSDFGSTAKVGQKRDYHVTTYAFCSPEGFDLNQAYQFASDIFSFAAVLGHLATRQMPWNNSNNRKQIQSYVCSGRRATFNDVGVHPKIAKLVSFCWQQKADKRPNCTQIQSYIRKNF